EGAAEQARRPELADPAPLDRLGAAGCVAGSRPGLVAERDVSRQGRRAAGHVGVGRVRASAAGVGPADRDHILAALLVVVEVARLPLAEGDGVAGAVGHVAGAEGPPEVLEDAVGGIGPGADEAPARADRAEVIVARGGHAERGTAGEGRRRTQERLD